MLRSESGARPTLTDRERAAARAIPRATAARVLETLRVRPLDALWVLPDALEAAGCDQADLVLCLLRLSAVEEAESVMGRPILRVPPLLAAARAPAVTPPAGALWTVCETRSAAFWRVMARIKHRRGGHPDYARMRRVRVGLTLQQLEARGVRRRDLGEARKRGWVRVAKMEAHASGPAS